MARAENQALQIALIVFVMLTIVLGVMTFFFFRSADEGAKQLATLQDSAKKDKEVTNKIQAEMNYIKTELLGVDPTMELGDTRPEGTPGPLRAAFKDDMQNFGATLPPERQHYRQALESLSISLEEKSTQLTETQANFNKLAEEHKHREDAKNPQIKVFEQTADKHDKDLQEERSKFGDDRKKALAAEEQARTDLAQVRSEKSTVEEQSRAQIQAVETAKAKIERDAKAVAAEVVALKDSNFEVADGLVRGVNTQNHTVYINLGRADRLPRLTTFSVHDASANTALGHGLKGSLEVVELLDNDEHMAMCRITDEDHANPIVRGDKIYSPLFDPGQQQHFAILGKIDLDNDGQDDRALVKNIIQTADGIIDAEMDDLGKITGQLTINTRYLIQGKIPEDKAAADGQAILLGQAETLGVEVIPAPRFFEISGWKNAEQLLRFGRYGNIDKVRDPAPDGGYVRARPNTQANFQQRRPWQPQKKSKNAKEETPKSAYDEKAN